MATATLEKPATANATGAEWSIWIPGYGRLYVNDLRIVRPIALAASDFVSQGKTVHVLHREIAGWKLAGWARKGHGHGVVAS